MGFNKSTAENSLGFLAKVRKDCNLSQPEMANVIGVSYTVYTFVERGYRTPSYDFIKRFKDAFPDKSADGFFQKGGTKQ